MIVGANGPAMHFHGFFHDRQAKTATAQVAVFVAVNAIETIENLLKILLFYAFAVVAKRYVLLVDHFHNYFSAARVESGIFR